MLLILLGLVVLLLVLTVLFFTFADGDLTLMLFERYGSKAGKLHFIAFCMYIFDTTITKNSSYVHYLFVII